MIKKFILGTLLSFCLLSPYLALTNTMTVTTNAAEAEEVTPYNSYYDWYYKEVDGVKYMRLWDNRNYCWVTNWIPVES